MNELSRIGRRTGLFDFPAMRLPNFRDFGFTDEMIKVDETFEEGHLIIRAELPGIDPEKDVEIIVNDGELQISAERKKEERSEGKEYVREELSYGKFYRSLPLPKGVTEDSVKATYDKGVLTVKIPAPKGAKEPKKISITASGKETKSS